MLVGNRIVRALREECDDAAQVAFLAYNRTLALPRRVTPHPGVFLEFAPIARSYGRPISDKASEQNRPLWSTSRNSVMLISDTMRVRCTVCSGEQGREDPLMMQRMPGHN
jgi:hypothetical protein